MIEETLDLPLEKLVLTPEGCEIFDILCLRLDVNQKYVDLLPQWRDVAHILQLDDLSTKWVEVCVRPREGLTRAMLEIYMKDGGTLGKSRVYFFVGFYGVWLAGARRGPCNRSYCGAGI